MKQFLLLALILTGLQSQAQTVHVHKLGADFDTKKVNGAKVHEYEPDLIKAQYEFQDKVFKAANVSSLVQSLNFVEKEDLLEVLEDEDSAGFLKRYPQFNQLQVKKLKEALYE